MNSGMNKTRVKRSSILRIVAPIIFIILGVVLAVEFCSASTMEQLISGYDYDYSDGSLLIITVSNRAIDTNANGINDTLIVSITSNATYGDYSAYVDLLTGSGIVVHGTRKNLTLSDSYFVVNFSSSEFPAQTQFNYSVRIVKYTGILALEKFNFTTNQYSLFESFMTILGISDQSINNSLIRINVSINSTQSLVTNVTVILTYESSSISSTSQAALTQGVQIVPIFFDNETIKSSHFKGQYGISTIVIGEKITSPQINTSIYDYEAFAKSSYIQNVATKLVDTNENNLSDLVIANFSLLIVEPGNYTVLAQAYDLNNNFIGTINVSATLSAGNVSLIGTILGQEIYKSRLPGPYKLNGVTLSKSNQNYDAREGPFIINATEYTQFERPALPDLSVAMSAQFNNATNITLLYVNVSNVGQAPAFNVLMLIRSNNTFVENLSFASLAINESLVFNYTIGNSTTTTRFVIFADIDNTIEEQNESNNIAIVPASMPLSSVISVDSLSVIKAPIGTPVTRYFRFVVNNNSTMNLSNVSLLIDPGPTNLTSNQNIALNASEDIFVYWKKSYPMGTHTVNVSATNGSYSDWEAITIEVGGYFG